LAPSIFRFLGSLSPDCCPLLLAAIMSSNGLLEKDNLAAPHQTAQSAGRLNTK
jgi:hypothetical protein